MARTSKKNALSVPANLTENRWINTPFAYTEFMGGLSLLQQDIMYKVSDNIQEYLKNYFDEGRDKTRVIPRPLFTEYEKKHSLKPIRVVFADYGVSANHYDQIEKAVREVLHITVRVPIIKSNGERVLKWVNIFTEGEAPITEGGYTFLQKVNDVEVQMKTVARSKGWIDFHINPDVADYVFDMSKGYINHPNSIARISTMMHTPSLYGLLKNRCGRNLTCRLTVNEIKEHLGLVKYDKDHEVESYTFPKYAHFKKYVLLRVQDDLIRLAAADQIDYTFNFKEVRRPGRSTGDPLYIEFELVRTHLGDVRDLVKHRRSANQQLINTLLDRCGDLRREVIEPIIVGVPDDDFADFSTYVYRDIKDIIEHQYPDDVATYTVALMRKWIEARNQRKAQEKQRPQPEPDLFSSQNVPVETRNSLEVPGEYADEWRIILSRYDGCLKPYLLKAKHIGSSRSYVWIEFPNKATHDAFEKAEHDNPKDSQRLTDIMMSVLGANGRILVRGYKKKPSDPD